MRESRRDRRRSSVSLGAAAVALVLAACSSTEPIRTAVQTAEPPIPDVQREFRAAWIATVANIDWPSQPGLTVAEQQAELRRLLDRAAVVGLNAVILQVRPAADAMYASAYEPWSEYLTGTMGRAPDPYYDPLAFAVDEAHRRGLELHAWFNPFRARHRTGTSPPDSQHVSVRLPELVRTYGEQMWLDPGDPRAREYSLNVMLDVVRRYDIDGVHVDDYFYPYEIKDDEDRIIGFPDDATWAAAQEQGVIGSRNDWRRSNIDRFIESLYNGIHEIKPWVRFGISPFGIWRPGNPPQIKGFDAYDRIYADSRKWLQSGWVDYMTPQLYWRIDPPEQSYPALLDWWLQQNPYDRHIWPGNFTARWSAEEIVRQVELTREMYSPSGNVHFSMKWLLRDTAEVSIPLANGPYREPALVPATSWLGGSVPMAPELAADTLRGRVVVAIRPRGEVPWLWTVQWLSAGKWHARIVPGWKQTYEFGETLPARIAIAAVSQLSQQGPRAFLSGSVTRDDFTLGTRR